MAKVKIQTFKDSGKWYDTIIFNTIISSVYKEKILREAEEKYPVIKNFNYTIKITEETEKGTTLNFTLILNKK